MLQMVYDGVETREMLRLTPEPPLSDDEYFDFCAANPDLRIERTAEGEIEIMPPTGMESSYRNSNLTMQLSAWALRDGRGISLDSHGEFFLRDGSARSPDASWIHRSKLAPLTRKQKRKFPHLCPDFVIELMSPSDRLSRHKPRCGSGSIMGFCWAGSSMRIAELCTSIGRVVK